ncbi:MAG: DNA gyrase subunit A [Candidatus Omnitrophota bacterium]|nr:DNA gyrase subunit A [Candidatus Omnitrophota bacterium]
MDGQGNFGCFTKDTKVKLCDGRSLSFKELIREQREGKKHWTFSFNHQHKKIEIAQIENPRLTRKNERIIGITIDNGEKIKCTLDHLFMLRDGSYKEAKDLKADDSLMPAYFNTRQIKDGNHYLSILQPFTGYYVFVHKLADEYNYGLNQLEENGRSYILHHKDFNRWNNSPDNIERLNRSEHYNLHLRQVKNLWKEKGNSFREKQRESLKKYFSQPGIRKELSDRSRRLWENPIYRAKYSDDHFKKMADKLWENPAAKEFHRRKLAWQRQEERFRRMHSQAVVASNGRRMQRNPDMMKYLTEKAKVALSENWQSSAYKSRVIRSKILGFTHSLLEKYPKITPEIYEKERECDGVPKLENALNYFENLSEIIEESQTYNHKILRTKILKKREDVYDLTTEPWHNFLLDAGIFVHNSIDNDPPAAQRYTEARLSAIAEEMLADIDKDTVNFGPNFDSSLKEPLLLPAALPNLLVNGSSGIAVGMATNIPSHNLNEVVDAIIYLLDHPEAEIKDLMRYIKGPDFPTGGVICGKAGIKEAYLTGRGKLLVRARATVERQKNGKDLIVITEIPYQIQKSALIESIAGLVDEKKLEGISDIRDESDKDGMRIVVELKRDVESQIILNQLFKHTQLENTFGIIMLALVENRPRVLNLRQVVEYYIEHRKVIIRRRTQFELDKALKRAHILEGLKIALKYIDRIIKVIKTSKNTENAKERLMKEFGLSDVQSQAILEMQLQRLTALERDKIDAEYLELLKKIELCKAILVSEKKVESIIKEDLESLKKKYGDERRTEIVGEVEELEVEDLIAEEDVVVTISHGGYIKRLPVSGYRKQKRGGTGASGAEVKEEDFIEHLFVASTKDYLLIFTGKGQVHWLKVYEIPQASRTSKGKAIINLVQMEAGSKISSTIPVKEFSSDKYLVMVTKQGQIKKTKLDAYGNPRKGGIIGITLDKGDELIGVELTDGKQELLIGTRGGKAIRFSESKVRDMGRQAGGVRAISLAKKDEVIGMVLAQKGTTILTVTELGFAKRTPAEEYRLTSRGGKGIINIKVTDKNKEAVSLKTVSDNDELMVITQSGMFLRCAVKDIRTTGRSSQGVRLIKLQGKDRVSGVAHVIAEEE